MAVAFTVTESAAPSEPILDPVALAVELPPAPAVNPFNPETRFPPRAAPGIALAVAAIAPLPVRLIVAVAAPPAAPVAPFYVRRIPATPAAGRSDPGEHPNAVLCANVSDELPFPPAPACPPSLSPPLPPVAVC